MSLASSPSRGDISSLDAAKNLLSLLQTSNLLLELRTLALDCRRLARDLLQLIRRELADEKWREEREWALVLMKQVVEGGLLRDVVDESLA